MTLVRGFLRLTVALLALSLFAAPRGWAQPAASTSLRVAKDASGKPLALQTSIAHYVLGSGQRVDLVSAVHLGEASYYAALNRRFRQYDAVLYELVLAGEGGGATGPISIPRDGSGASGLSQVQLALCRMLGLEFQLYEIDYRAPNFRHADLTYEEFQRAMAQSGESTSDLLMKIIQIAMTNTSGIDERELERLDLLSVMMRGPSPREQRVLRRVFASCFPEIDRLTAQLQGTTLIAGRNRRAMEVLARELRAGRRSLALFYGAGHMADLERRVQALPGATLSGREWVDAWRLEEPSSAGRPSRR